ncbi:hypothetical protein A2U01_0066044 [Trifolium medium]|uniref:Uncharacterized protein n=1 Tax=Trifolium medium TaxID=97028 RepID=A0A392SAB4_9FABA|nr:hypothetical protein [Trifolium medium]
MSFGCKMNKSQPKSTLCTAPARSAAWPGAARRRQSLNVASKQAWRAAQHPWARRAPTRNHQNLQNL